MFAYSKIVDDIYITVASWNSLFFARETKFAEILWLIYSTIIYAHRLAEKEAKEKLQSLFY